MMKMKLLLSLLLVLQLFCSAIGQTIITSPNPLADGLFGVQVAAGGGSIVTSDNPGNGGSIRHVYAYRKSGNTWATDGSLANPAQVASDNFGASVAVDDYYAVVGAPGVSGEQGRAYVFKRTGANAWNLEATLVGSDVAAGDQFGRGVAISGNNLVVGAPAKNNGIGKAYVFSLSNGTWQEVAILTPVDAPNGRFGTWLTMHEDYIAVASHQREKVFVFKRNGSNWAQQALLEPPVSNGSYGVSCSIFKDRLIVGALNDDEMGNNAGAVYAYKRTGDNWALEQKLFANDAAEGKSFGGRIALSENYAVIGTLYEVFDINGTDGSAYIFQREGTSWTQIEKYNTPEFDYMGWYNAIDGNTAVVGAYGADIAAEDAGALYIYDLPAVINAVKETSSIELGVFPNPARETVQLSWPAGYVAKSAVLMSPSGAVLQRLELTYSSFHIQHLSPGIYYLKVDFGDQTGIGVFQKI